MVIRVVAVLFCLGGIVHWLIIFGVMEEVTPLLITIYFHSLAVLSPLTGIGLWLMKEWGRKLGLLIVLTQIPAHVYLLYLDRYTEWNSGVAAWERGLDVAFAFFYIAYFQRGAIKNRFRTQVG